MACCIYSQIEVDDQSCRNRFVGVWQLRIRLRGSRGHKEGAMCPHCPRRGLQALGVRILISLDNCVKQSIDGKSDQTIAKEFLGPPLH